MGRHISITIVCNYNWNDFGVISKIHQSNRAIQIIEAQEEDSIFLTNIAFEAKRHWPYPDEYFNIWKNELTISPHHIEHNIVFKAVFNKKIVGFYSLTYLPNCTYNDEIKISKGWWLEHLFVLPNYHKQSIGKQLIDHCKTTMRHEQIKELSIFVDPYAIGFYEKIGATFTYDSPSSIPGRKLPVYTLTHS